MHRGVQNSDSVVQVADDLEPYHRLVELQKQMIKLAQENERAKRECAVLREKVARQVAAQMARQKLSQRLKLKLRKQFAKLKFGLKKSDRVLSPDGPAIRGATVG